VNKKNQLRLIHLANFNSTNIGNGALIDGLENTVKNDFPVSVEWLREPWDDYTFGLIDFDESFVDKVNTSDGLIIGGAVTFNGRDYNRRTGTRFELPFELWPQVAKPVVLYGLSYRHWQGQTYHHLDKLKITIEKILEAPNMMLTLRNDGTRKWLLKMTGIESSEILDVPDPALFVRPDLDAEYTEFVEGAKNVMIAFNDEDSTHRFDERFSEPNKLILSRDHVVKSLVTAMERLAEDYPINFILVPHYFDDYKMVTAFLEQIRPQLAHQRMVSTGLCMVKDTRYFYGRYTHADLAISMRVHSMSPCIGLGTPMVAYTTQNRMTDFMDGIGLQDFYVNSFLPNSGDTLYQRARHVLDNGDDVRKQLADTRSTLRADAKIFHQKVYDFLSS
jgi:polysaccharide pyruvyl transferase WcaK-like protein